MNFLHLSAGDEKVKNLLYDNRSKSSYMHTIKIKKSLKIITNMNWKKKEINATKGVFRFTKKDIVLNKKITTYYTESERDEIGDFCKKKGISMNEFTRSAIAQYLKSNS